MLQLLEKLQCRPHKRRARRLLQQRRERDAQIKPAQHHILLEAVLLVCRAIERDDGEKVPIALIDVFEVGEGAQPVLDEVPVCERNKIK